MANEVVEALIPILTDITNTRYSELASSSIIVYDYLLTLDQEIQYVWRARWTIGKVLFFLNRYYTLFIVVFNNYALFTPHLTDDIRIGSCFHWFRWQGWTGLIVAALAEITLQLRLYALYYGNKKVLALMVGFFISAMTSSAVIMGTVLRDIKARANLIPGMKFCVPLNASSHFYAFWVPILAFETLLCSLACIRGYRSYRDYEIRRLGNLRRRQRESHLPDTGGSTRGLNILEILLRDSVGYFIIMFATYLTTTLIWIFGRITVIEIPVGFTVALSSVIANRLLLNLRGSQKKGTSNVHNPNASSSHSQIGSMAHATSIIGLGTTVEMEHGRENLGFELEELRKLKASTY